MDPNTIILIMKGIELIGTLAPVAIETAIKIKKLLESPGSDITAEIKVMRDGAIVTADETTALIDAWMKENGVTP